MSADADGSAALREAVLAAADEIRDPCSVAAAQPMGLGEMGLIREVRIASEAGGRAVEVILGLTAPGCLYWVYFERELRARVSALPGVTDVSVRRDAAYDWSEADIAPAARRRLAEGRARRLAHARAAQAASAASHK